MDSPPTQETSEYPAKLLRTERSALSRGPQVTDGPLIVQSDKTLLLEVDHPAVA